MKLKRLWLTALCVAMALTAGLYALPYTISPALAQCGQNFGSNWTGYYWNVQDFSGNPTITRTDPAINFNWQTGSPDPAIPSDHFSARWYGTFNFDAGTYQFSAGADDGVRVAVDGGLVINRFSDATNGFEVDNGSATLTAGTHSIIVDYFEDTGNAGIQVYWQPSSCVSGSVSATTASGSNAIPSPTVPPGIAGLPVSGVHAVVIVQLANVRSGPSTATTPIAEVKQNQDFHVIANNGANTWFLIQLPDGTRGWIFRRMIYLYNGDPTKLPVSQESVAQPGPLTDVQGIAVSGLIVRSAPTKRGDKIGAVNQGQYFKILQLSVNSAWVFIDADGLNGWVYLPYVKVVYGVLGRLPRSDTAPM